MCRIGWISRGTSPRFSNSRSCCRSTSTRHGNSHAFSTNSTGYPPSLNCSDSECCSPGRTSPGCCNRCPQYHSNQCIPRSPCPELCSSHSRSCTHCNTKNSRTARRASRRRSCCTPYANYSLSIHFSICDRPCFPRRCTRP